MKSKIFIILLITVGTLWCMGNKPKEMVQPLLDTFTRDTYGVYLNNQNNAVQQLLNSPDRLNKLIKVCRNNKLRVNKLYLEIEDFTDQQQLAKMIEKLNAKNIQAYLLFDDISKITNKQYYKKNIEQLLAYNNKHPEQQFAGIFFNLKLYLHPGWFNDPELIIKKELEILQESKKLLAQNNSSLTLGVSIPYEYGLNAKAEEKLVRQIFNYINYLHISVISNDYLTIEKNITRLAQYAHELDTGFSLNILLLPNNNNTVSYHGLPLNYLKDSLTELEKTITKKYPDFEGFIFDDFNYFQRTIQQSNNKAKGRYYQLTKNQNIELLLTSKNFTIATLNVTQTTKKLIITIKVSDYFYFSTAKGVRENNITDDHIEIQIFHPGKKSSCRHALLAFKGSSGFADQQPYLTPVTPRTYAFDNWQTTGQISSDNYQLKITIPKKELFFNNLKENNSFGINLIVRDTDNVKKRLEKEYNYQALTKEQTIIQF